MTTAAIRAAVYSRVSTEEQAREEKHSLQQQREKCAAYAKAHDWEVAEVYEDGGVSGAKEHRPALDRMMADARAGKFQAVIFAKVDRLARNLRHLVNVEHGLSEVGVSIASVEDGFDTSTASGRLHFNVLGSIAEFEREQIKLRTANGREGAAREGRFLCGNPSYGYDYDKTTQRLVVNEAEAATVRRIYQAYVGEGLSYTALAKRLNAEGVPTKTNRAGARSHDGIKKGWLPATVEKVLKNRAYLGEAYFNKTSTRGDTKRTATGEDERIPVHCPRIIDDDLFKAARSRAKQNQRRARLIPRGKDERTVFLLSGLLRCGECDRRMYGSAASRRTGKVYRYLLCQGQAMYGTPCHTPKPRADAIEGAVLNAIFDAYRDPQRVMGACDSYAEMLQAAAEAQDGIIAGIKAKLAEAVAEKDRLIEGWRKGFYGEADMNKHVGNVDKEIEACEDELRRLEAASRQREAAEEIEKAAWAIAGQITGEIADELTIQEKKELIRGLVERVTIKAGGGIEIECLVPGLLNSAKVPIQQTP